MTVNGSKRLRVLVVDGDDVARRKLRLLMESFEQPVRVDDAASVPQAAAKLGEMAPDLVVLDLDLPGAPGIEILRAADAPCIVVTTAHPEQSLRTLDLDAVDCLVKPVERERLGIALRHARRRLAERRIAGLALEIAGAAAAIRDSAPSGAHGAGCYADQMTIRVRRRMFALAVADIAWVEGASQYSRVHAKGGEFLLSRSLSSLESELDPARFFRIHRSTIVNADYVREVMSRGDGRYNVYLQGGEALSLGRGRKEVLRRLLSSLKAGGDSPPKKSGGPKAAASG
jgi:two-component system, LytTR family, response regulator